MIAKWERELREGQSGRVPTGRSIHLSLRRRFTWPHLEAGATAKEKVYGAWRLGEELKGGRFPASPELAERLTALLGRLQGGPSPGPEAVEAAVHTFYPDKLAAVVCRSTLLYVYPPINSTTNFPLILLLKSKGSLF